MPHNASVSITIKQRRAITGGVMLAMFLAALDATVVSTAMPTVIAQLGGFEVYSWVFSAYMLTSTVTVPIWGKLSDLYGRKRFFLLGIGLFVLGSMLAGQSNSMAMLIATRALQGLGAGALFPLSITIIGDLYSLEQRARMQGLFSGIWGFASVIGPITGGFLTDALSWRWVFYVNLPIGIAAALVVAWTMHESRHPKAQVKIDYLGALSLTVSMTLLLLSLLRGGQLGWSDPGVALMMFASLILLLFFVWWEHKAAEPLLPLSLFQNRIFTAVAISGLFVGMAMFGTITFLPLFVQAVLGTSATEAGSSLTPFMLAWVVSSAIGGRLLLRIGYRRTVFIGMGMLMTGFILFTTFTASVTRAFVLTAVAFAGAGMGLIIVSLLLAVQNSVSKRQLGIATSATVFTRSIGGTIGVAVLGTVMTLGMQAISNLPVSGLTPSQVEQLRSLAKHPDALVSRSSDGIAPEVLDLLRSSLASALHNVFLFGLGFVILSLLAAFLIPKGKAQDHVYTGEH